MDVSRETQPEFDWGQRALEAAVAGASALGLSLQADILPALLAHLIELASWNEAAGLTGKLSPVEVGEQLLLDSLLPALIWPGTKADALCDIGSGNGFPAIPLALAWKIDKGLLYESRAKKAWFLQRALRASGLSGYKVIRKQWRQSDSLSVQSLITSKAALPPEIILEAAARYDSKALLYLGPSVKIKDVLRIGNELGLEAAAVELELPISRAHRSYILAWERESPAVETG
jgi:16S rRNA (guanine527-N7)-methyltransferase